MNGFSRALRPMFLGCVLGLLVGGAAVHTRAADRKIVKKVEPAYPDVLRTRSIGGVVKLKVTVAEDGRVRTVKVEGGNPVLADSAARAVKEWRYAPSDRETVEEVTIRFDAGR